MWQHRRGQIWGKRRSTSPGARQRTLSVVWAALPESPSLGSAPGEGGATMDQHYTSYTTATFTCNTEKGHRTHLPWLISFTITPALTGHQPPSFNAIECYFEPPLAWPCSPRRPTRPPGRTSRPSGQCSRPPGTLWHCHGTHRGHTSCVSVHLHMC